MLYPSAEDCCSVLLCYCSACLKPFFFPLMFDWEVLAEDFPCLSQICLNTWIYFMLRPFNLSVLPTEVCLVLLQGA